MYIKILIFQLSERKEISRGPSAHFQKVVDEFPDWEKL